MAVVTDPHPLCSLWRRGKNSCRRRKSNTDSLVFQPWPLLCKLSCVFTFMLPCIVIDFFLNPQPDALIIQIYCYKTLHVSGIFFVHHQEFFTVHSALVSFMQVFHDRLQEESACSILTLLRGGHQKPARNLPVPNIQWKTPGDGQIRCPKHVEFYNRINFDN